MRTLLSAAVPHIKGAWPFNSPKVSRALHGLKNTDDSPEARRVLSALTIHLEGISQLDPRAISSAFRGLQRMNGNSEV